MTDNQDPLAGDKATIILPPDYTLKKMIGENVDIKQIFSEEKVANAQEAIDNYRDKFLEWAIKDIATLDECLKNKDIKAIEEISDRLKGQAGTFNFDLGTLVAKSLNKYCNSNAAPSAEQMVVIRKHLDTLAVVFGQKITGDGGTIGKELLENLFKLVEKYK